ACPRCQDAARRLGSAADVDKVHDAVVFTDVEIPDVAGRVTAIRGILYGEQFGRAGAQWQVKLALIDRAGALVPISMEREQRPIIVVDETWIDLIFHGVGLAAKVGACVANLDG